MNCDKVINFKTGLAFDYVEFNPMNDDDYIKMFGSNVPAAPFMDPVVDPLAIYLFKNAGMLQRMLHNIKTYGCVDPIFMDGKKMYATSFSYTKEFIKFRDSYLSEKHRAGFIENWKRNVAIAIAKLSGQMYSSAGAD